MEPIAEKITFTFHGQTSIDAKLLAKSIGDIDALVSQTAASTAPRARINIRVAELRPGSIQIVFDTLLEVGKFIWDNSEKISAIGAAIIGFFQIKAHLKGKKAAKSEKVENNATIITNAEGKSIIVNSAATIIFNSSTINKSAASVADDAYSHDPNGGLSISTNDGCFSSNELDSLRIPFPIETQKETILGVHVFFIHQAVFEGKRDWYGRLDSPKSSIIRVSIEDTDWLKRVHSRELKFAAGDAIRVSLKSEFERDSLGQIVQDKVTYSIIKVLSEIIPPDSGEQISFFK